MGLFFEEFPGHGAIQKQPWFEESLRAVGSNAWIYTTTPPMSSVDIVSVYVFIFRRQCHRIRIYFPSFFAHRNAGRSLQHDSVIEPAIMYRINTIA